MTQTLAQRRAKYALQEVKRIDQLSDVKLKSRVRVYAQSLPAMVQMNGLGPAMAFCRSKNPDSDRAYHELYEILSGWLTDESEPHVPYGKGYTPEQKAGRDLLDAITRSDMRRYRAAQVEALAFLEWLKRFAAAYLPSGKDAKKAEESAKTEDGDAGEGASDV